MNFKTKFKEYNKQTFRKYVYVTINKYFDSKKNNKEK